MNKKFILVGLFIGSILFAIIAFFDYSSKKEQEEREQKELARQQMKDEMEMIRQDSINKQIERERRMQTIDSTQEKRTKDSLDFMQIRDFNRMMNDNLDNAYDGPNDKILLGTDGIVTYKLDGKVLLRQPYDRIYIKEDKDDYEDNDLEIGYREFYYEKKTGSKVYQYTPTPIKFGAYDRHDFLIDYNRYCDIMDLR